MRAHAMSDTKELATLFRLFDFRCCFVMLFIIINMIMIMIMIMLLVVICHGLF